MSSGGTKLAGRPRDLGLRGGHWHLPHPAGTGTRLLEAARMALRALRVNRLRSALTGLGIIIGIAAVIVLVALGNGLRTGFTESFGSLANEITVRPTTGAVPGGGIARPLRRADLAALTDPVRAPSVAAVTPLVTGTAPIRLGGRAYRSDLVGSTEAYLDVSARSLRSGSFFAADDVRAANKVVVLGATPVREMFGGDANAALHQQIRIGRTPFTVIGTLVEDGQHDDSVVVPLATAQAYLVGGNDELDQIIVTAVGIDAVASASDEVSRILSDRHNIREPAKRDFEVTALRTLIEESTQFLGYLTWFVGAVAAISLVVGGIGVANIMLVAVTERTREIGIRKALGATRRAVLSQFLIEATVLTGLGGVIGIGLGIGLSVAAGAALGHAIPNFPRPEVFTGSVLIAFLVSVLIGLVAGCYPAVRAARLQPIAALRYE